MALTWLREMLGNWGRAERNKINDNWTDIEKGFADQSSKNSNLQSQINTNKNTATNAAQTANQAKVIAEGIDSKATEALNTANTANGKSDNAVQTADAAKEQSEYVQAQLDKVVADGDSSAEVVQARKDFVNLRERLDAENAQVTAQLAHTEHKKADKTYVDTLIANVANGGPRDVFYSVAALNAAYPNGEIGTYLVFDSSFTDGAHAFIWDGSTWVDLGIYQSAADSVTQALTEEGQEWVI